MERNQIIGIVLIMATFMLWTITSAPSKEEKEKAQRIQDSIALVQQTPINSSAGTVHSLVMTTVSKPVNVSLTTEAGKLKAGAFSPGETKSSHREMPLPLTAPSSDDGAELSLSVRRSGIHTGAQMAPENTERRTQPAAPRHRRFTSSPVDRCYWTAAGMLPLPEWSRRACSSPTAPWIHPAS